MSGAKVKVLPLNEPKQHVVVLGGGVAGVSFAKALVAKKLDIQVTLVTASPFAEAVWCMPFVLCKPEDHYRAMSTTPEKYAAGVTCKVGVVTAVDREKKEVTLNSQETLAYDKLVVATGFRMPVFYPKVGASLQERRDEVKRIGASIKAANHVIVGGGGPTACELAGQIRVTYPEKNVTLVCKSLLPQWEVDDVALIEKQIETMGIAVKKVDARCPMDPVFEAITVSGVSGDLYLPAFSQGPNTEFLQSSGLLDATRRIKVNNYLQSEQDSSIYAIGVSDAVGFVSIPKLEDQWKIVVANIVAEASGKSLSMFAESVPSMTRQPVVFLGVGKGAWGFVDFKQMPTPAQVCCCNGYGGFPFCPPLLCWPCCGCCLCGYCGGSPHGNGVPNLYATTMWISGGLFFKGMGEDKPPVQQTMEPVE